MSGAAAAPDGPHYWGSPHIENDNLALISAKYERVKSKLRNHGFVKLCYHHRLDDGRIIVLSYKHIMLC